MVPPVMPPSLRSGKIARKWAIGASLGAAALLGVAACGSPEGVQLCGEIPEGGCPAGRGGSCDDTTCTGLYDCVEGDWTEIEPCEGNPTSTSSAAAGAGGGDDGAGGCALVAIDHEGEAEGCTPDLLDPDCPAVAAEVCAPCETGCADFFLCTDDGWIDVAACDDAGQLVIIAR